MKRAGNTPLLQKSLKSATCIDVKSILNQKFGVFFYTDDDKPEMTIPKQIDIKVTKPQRINTDMEELENVPLQSVRNKRSHSLVSAHGLLKEIFC